MEPGIRVRFKADPGRTGVTTGRSRERAGRSYIQVVFPDRPEFVPYSHIEVVPVFLSGGGGQMPLYREALKSAANMLMIIWAGFQWMELPKPSDLQAPGLDTHHYHRLAVAYGLSFSSLDIGRITPPGEIPNIAANLGVLNVPSRYVSKDMV